MGDDREGIKMRFVKDVLELIEDGNKLMKAISHIYGIIYKQVPAKIHDEKGFLIWDYILFNEITFKDMQGNIYSLFKSWSDTKTEKVWDELVKKYGV